LRLQAALICKIGEPEKGWSAEDRLRTALRMAEAQGAIAWQVRISHTLANVYADQGRLDEAKRFAARAARSMAYTPPAAGPGFGRAEGQI
jgi:hypothetical protein